MPQLCTIWSNLSDRSLVAREPRRLDHAAALGRQHLLVLAGNIIFADRAARMATGWRSGCKASPRDRVTRRVSSGVSIRWVSSSSAIAG